MYYFQSFPLMMKYLNCAATKPSNLFCPLPCVIQQTTSLHRPLHQLLPAALHAEQQVLDQDHILFLAEVLQMCSCLVQFNDVIPVGVHLCHEHLHSAEGERRLGQVF